MLLYDLICVKLKFKHKFYIQTGKILYVSRLENVNIKFKICIKFKSVRYVITLNS